MATKAFVNISRAFTTNDPTTARFRAVVDYVGDGVLVGDPIGGPHDVDSGDVLLTTSSVQLKNQIIDVVLADAASRGLTVGNGDVILGSLEIV